MQIERTNAVGLRPSRQTLVRDRAELPDIQPAVIGSVALTAIDNHGRYYRVTLSRADLELIDEARARPEYRRYPRTATNPPEGNNDA